MCYILFSRYPCGHTKEQGTEQCAIWLGTQSFCPKPASKSLEEVPLCYECTIESEALSFNRKDIDNLAGIVLARLTDTLPSADHLPQQESVQRNMKRVTDLYSKKLQSAERELRSLKESVAEKKREERPQTPGVPFGGADFGSLWKKVEGFNNYWRGQIKMHEEQMEKAGRLHATWMFHNIGKKLEYAHDKWERQIEDIFRGAEEVLPEIE